MFTFLSIFAVGFVVAAVVEKRDVDDCEIACYLQNFDDENDETDDDCGCGVVDFVVGAGALTVQYCCENCWIDLGYKYFLMQLPLEYFAFVLSVAVDTLLS